MNPPISASGTTQTPELWDVLDAMELYGGSFVRHLAKAWRAADGDNQKRLREAFPHYYSQYEDAARQQMARQAVRP